MDRGVTFQLIGRVAKAALRLSAGAAGTLPQVERSGPRGIALAVGERKMLRVLPDTTAARRDPAAITVNVGQDEPLFRLLVPPAGSPVRQEVRRVMGPLPPVYAPTDGDQLVIIAPHSDISAGKLPDVAADAASRYLALATRRMTAQGRHAVSGTLRIAARLRGPNDRPSAVWISADAGATAILNSPPYEVRWDTTGWADGEHLIDIRALDAAGGIMTRAKTLVITRNHG